MSGDKAEITSKDVSKKVCEFVGRRITALAQGGESAARASFARLRRGVGKSPWSIPALWGLVFEGMPDECSNDCAAENAIYAAITLYAMHQQSRDVKKSPMSVPKVSLGAAVHRLASVRDGDQWNKGPVWRRFVRAVTSNDVEEFALHLRGLVQFLRSEGISLDYPALAENLYWFHFSKGRDRVRRSWGLDFYKNKKEDTKNDEE